MKRLLPTLVLTFAASASCMLDLQGLPGADAGSGGSTATSSVTGTGSGSGTTASASSSGGAGGEAATSTSSASSSSSGTGGNTTGWTRRRKLTLDSGIDEDLKDFSIMVRLEKDWFDYGQTRNEGQDLRFVGDQNNVLDHEIERWDEKGVSIIWVKIPSLKQNSSPLPTIWMYYGNDKAADGQHMTNVWSNGYRGVWHLGETDNKLTDSSGKTLKADNHGTTQSDGLIGKARRFNAGKKQYIDTNNWDHLSNFTIEVWVQSGKSPSLTNGPNGPLMREQNYQILWDHKDPFSGSASFQPSGGLVWNAADMKPLNPNTWYYLVATYDGATLRTYRDGAHLNSDVAASPPNLAVTSAKLGRHAVESTPMHFFDGDIDEVRIANTSRSDKWILAQHKSMRGNLAIFGQEETAGGPWTVP